MNPAETVTQVEYQPALHFKAGGLTWVEGHAQVGGVVGLVQPSVGLLHTLPGGCQGFQAVHQGERLCSLLPLLRFLQAYSRSTPGTVLRHNNLLVQSGVVAYPAV